VSTTGTGSVPASRHRSARDPRLAALLRAGGLVLLARCASAPPAEPRHGDEIVAAGRSLRIGTPVVLWRDDGGYDAYQTQKRFTVEPVPDGRMRYRKVRSSLPDEIAARVAERGWTLDDLQQVVHLFVVHFDVAGTARRCFEILQDKRNLSVHFLLDTDGTLYQTLDLQEHAQHATIANAASVGIEIAHPGCWPRERHPDMLRWYERDVHGWRMKFPAFLGETGLRTVDFVPRPDRDEVVAGTIHGRQYWQLDFTAQQYRALAHLAAGLHRLFPRIRLDVPRDDAGAIVTTNLPAEQLLAFDGIVGHFHVQRNKQDPGPAFQWERLLEDARALAAQGASLPPSTVMQQGPMMPR
jgi:N-acetyl-anhydromuramyl-L-alanine amidase AmpD